ASTVSLRNAKDLTTSSWANYSQLEELSIRKDLEIYHNDKRVDINYLDRYMKFSDAVTYVALEKSFVGDVVKQISIYDDTDFLLDRDFISTVSGNNITLSDGYNQLNVGDGSIIVKNGRLVDINSLMPNDYAHISRNGSKVAVANITEPINNNELALQRGRVYSVAENESFRVESIATYGNSNWDYSPVQRDYLIDYDTVFLNSAGNVISIDQFRDYSTNTSYSKAYNIFSDGTKATLIVEQPYVQDELKGVIAENNNGTLVLKDVSYFDSEANKWNTVSYENNYINLALDPSNVIVKDSQFINRNNLLVGDNVRVLLNEVPDNIGTGSNITGYIIFVEE
ncbi:MAG: hypothetical protein ACK5LV_07410, partial [Lachnospirales bacterium]